MEKGSEVGAHILSGAVIDPIGLDRLFPDWRQDEERPLKTQVTDDHFMVLTETARVHAAELADAAADEQPRQLYRLARRGRALAGAHAEGLGVEIYPGFAATEVLYDDNGAVVGVATGDMGVGRDGEPKANFTRGMELRGKYTLFAEGARGSLAKQLIARFELRRRLRAAEIRHRHQGALAGRRRPSSSRAWCSTLRLAARRRRRAAARSCIITTTISSRSALSSTSTTRTRPVAVRRVPALQDPSDDLRDTFEGGKRIAFGARAINEGGWQSVPKLVFPGGALIGCSAGFVNLPRIKGNHNAMLSGIAAAEAAQPALKEGRAHDELKAYEEGWRRVRHRP